MIYKIVPIIVILFLIFSFNLLNGDAYLSNEDIHYGANSYKINYEKKIIIATGNAYFKKEDKLLLANKIIIFYSKRLSEAKFYGNVVLKDQNNNSTIKGRYGFVKYARKIYFLSGNVKYKDSNEEIFSDRVYYFSKRNLYLFEGNVDYKNVEYNITANKLKINEDKAMFYNRVKLINNEKSETLNSNYLDYNLKNNDSFFKGQVIYQSNRENNNFLVSADVIKYKKDTNDYYLINNVIIISKNYMIDADFMVYNSNKDYLRAVGNVIARGKNFIIRGDSYIINNVSKEINFLKNIYGVFKIRSKE